MPEHPHAWTKGDKEFMERMEKVPIRIPDRDYFRLKDLLSRTPKFDYRGNPVVLDCVGVNKLLYDSGVEHFVWLDRIVVSIDDEDV